MKSMIDKNSYRFVQILIAALMLLTLAKSVTAEDWPMFRHDAAHIATSDEVVNPQLSVLWKITTGDGVISSPAVSGGV